MDVGSPAHLERLRDKPEIKAALLCFGLSVPGDSARFERNAKNGAYWPPIDQLAARFVADQRIEELRTPVDVYNRPCWLIATVLSEKPDAPYAIALTASDGAPPEELIAELRSVTHDYWFGSYFWK